MSSAIREAVTAVLVHDGDLFLTRRQTRLAAFPGYHAFPGGKVDRIEDETPFAEGPGEVHPTRLLRALLRELQEELSFDLGQALADDDVIAIVDLGISVTPVFSSTRFSTHFFRIELRRRPPFTLEIEELTDGEWAAPAEWLARYERGELLLAPPTLATIQSLAADPTAVVVKGLQFAEPADSIPMFEAVRGVRQFFVRSATLPPAEHTNCFLLGDDGSHRILVDPSPRDDGECERLCAQLREASGAASFDEIFLTHHHPDHRQRADVIARRFGVPIGMSADTQARIAKKSPRFFEGVSVKNWVEGDVVTQWLGHPLRVVAVPGHDEGQLALMPDNRAWFLVGDLIQGIGTVVIAAPEGDMAKYFATLERVIALKPRVIYPSHGGALGGTHYLQQTLDHRRARELQIKSLIDSGLSVEQTLGEVYKGLDPRLLPLARMNIESHLAKLRSEGAITL
jgi:glyoxylase-like metal-dependent hydrolase (beta-lactamase superfamily II)/8-oxo-dGTP pyrophosphatase MutT (NUDIX family)